MNRCLIFLTTDFPYSKGETFIENEISYLSKSFDKIIILAVERDPDETSIRAIPENVDCYNISSVPQKKSKLIDTLKGAAGIFNVSENLKDDKDLIKNSVARKAFANYFENRAHRKFKDCKPILDKYNFSEYDSVLIYSYWFFITCRLGVEIKNYLSDLNISASLVSRAHGYDLYSYCNSLNYLPERSFLASEVEKIYPCSKDGEAYLKGLIPDFAQKIECAYLGTNDRGLSVETTKLFHIVTCSRTVKLKRLNKLVDSFYALKNMNYEIYWTHIGDGSEQENVKKLATEKLDFMNFEFLGNMSNSDVYEYYKTHPINLFVNVSSTEGLPVSIMEAISFGIPVLATDVGGTGEIVIDNFNGKLLSRDFTANEFVNAFTEIYESDEDKYNLFRLNARKHWENNFNASENYIAFTDKLTQTKTVN